MKNFLRLLLFGTLLSPGSQALAAPDFADVPAYPQSKALCNEHVSGNTMHILWKSFSTPDAVPAVVAFYEKKLGVKATPDEHQSFLLTPAAKPELKISVYPKAQAKNFPECRVAAEATATTVILISNAIH